MKSSFLQHKWFYIPYLVAISSLGFFLVRFSKSDIHLWLNQYHNSFCDVFFSYITNLGDGVFLPLFLLIMLLVRFRETLLMLAVFLLSGLFVQILKRFVFDDVDRPSRYFEGKAFLYFVPGLEQHCCNSFPSGHSATAFSVFLVFAMVAKSNVLKFAFFILACLVAFSRVYLSQHFLIDIVAGSFIGVITVAFCAPLFNSFRSDWLNSNILTLNRKK